MATFVTPWSATVVRTTNVAPTMGTVNTYSVATGGYTVTLPPLNSVTVGARTMIEKDRLAVDGNLITVTRSGTDTFFDGTTSFTIGSAGNQVELQAVLVGGVRYWKRFDGGGSSTTGITASSVDILTNKTLTAPKFANGGYIADQNGNEQWVFNSVASAVNGFQSTNSATGNPVVLAPFGGDANIDTWINGAGTGRVFLNGGHRAVTIDEGATLSNKRIIARSNSITSSATPSINTDITDIFLIQALAVNVTSMTSGLTGSPSEGDLLWIGITGTATRTITWGAKFVGSTVALPTTTVGTARLDVGLVYDLTNTVWRCVAVA